MYPRLQIYIYILNLTLFVFCYLLTKAQGTIITDAFLYFIVLRAKSEQHDVYDLRGWQQADTFFINSFLSS